MKKPKNLKTCPAITQSGIKTLFYGLLNKAEITKKISPYYLRHSRITSMIADEIPQSVVMLQAWGNLSSKMMSTYTHLQNADIDRILLTRAGVVTEDIKRDDTILKPRQCPNCGKVHTPTTRFCDECGTALTGEAITQVQTDEQRLFEEFKKFMAIQQTK
jgi:hypothetical protein